MNIFDVLIVQPIFNLLIGLYALIPGGDFGLSLIIFTIIVRLALWPLVKKQLHQTQAIRKIQPELAQIKKRTKGNKQLAGMQTLELYRKNGINPFRSIGILLIQLPIFLALFRVIQIITNERDRVADFAYGFMENLAPIRAIIDNPANFNEMLFGVVDLTERAVNSNGINIFLLLIAVAAAVLQYYLSKQTMPESTSNKGLREIMAEAAEGKQADQAEMNAVVMNKMIKFLPIMMFFIMITVPGALALYYGVSNLVAVLQQSFILRQYKEADAKTSLVPEKTTKPTPKKATQKAQTKITRISATDNSPKAKKRR